MPPRVLAHYQEDDMPLLKFRDLYATPDRVVQADEIAEFPAELAEYLVASGTAAYAEDADLPSDEPGTDDEGDTTPARSASKRDWVAYAVDHGVDEEAAEDLTRDELVEMFVE